VWSSWENLALFDCDGNLLSSIAAFDSSLAGVEPSPPGGERLRLNQNHPNPFLDTTTIVYLAPGAEEIELSVYDPCGRKVITLVRGSASGAPGSVEWDGRRRDGSPVSPGVYFCTLRSGSESTSRKMVLLRSPGAGEPTPAALP
jgi:hypothetical protein